MDKRKVEMVLEYQNYIENAPVSPKQLYGSACSSDQITIESWRETWVKHVKENHEHFKSFKDHSIGKLFGINQYKPAVIVGSGPSLGYNGVHLKEKAGIMAISCLHNYHFFEDNGVDIDYYVTLDAGSVVVEEVYEGGSKTPDEYWASTKNKKLCAFIGTDPELFKRWQGEVYLFNAPVPDPKYIETVTGLEEFNCYISNGGNVLGACLYIAKAVMGSNPIAYMGADFSFGYNNGTGNHFHSWSSKYDAKLGNVMRGVDVFGNKVLTWPSYWNFKNFFDYVSLSIPGIYINCTEGGMLGAYPDGNIMSIRQMAITDFLNMYRMNEPLKPCFENPSYPEKRLLF